MLWVYWTKVQPTLAQLVRCTCLLLTQSGPARGRWNAAESLFPFSCARRQRISVADELYGVGGGNDLSLFVAPEKWERGMVHDAFPLDFGRGQTEISRRSGALHLSCKFAAMRAAVTRAF
jgi:hypothetical protein